jgi:4-alpha-glucanotransferase
MIRAGLRAGGGLRIDHAFGLARLWVIPEGGATQDGAYLAYPFLDLVRLATLEAHRAGALVIAEDLGTAPHGFTQAVTERRMLGMRVLWFERAADHGFIGAQRLPPLSAAMTGTHDTVTVAGWWRGRDLDWAERLGRLPEGMTRAEAEAIREWDRGLLWSTLDHTARALRRTIPPRWSTPRWPHRQHAFGPRARSRSKTCWARRAQPAARSDTAAADGTCPGTVEARRG